MEQPSYYAIIPANVRYDKNLPDKAKLLYGEITALANKESYCWANNAYFANLYGVAIGSISRLISTLHNNGYIAVDLIYKESKNKKPQVDKRIIRIIQPQNKNNDTYAQNCVYPINNKVKENTTRVNKKNKNIIIEHSNECPVDIPNSFPKKTSIFSELTQVYGKDRSEQMIEFVSTYIDDTYVELTGKQHKKELKAKRATFAKKLLEMTELFIMTFEELEELFETIIAEIDLDEVDPTIYYLTSSKVLGYWLLTTEIVNFDMLRDTEYQPVEEMY